MARTPVATVRKATTEETESALRAVAVRLREARAARRTDDVIIAQLVAQENRLLDYWTNCHAES